MKLTHVPSPILATKSVAVSATDLASGVFASLISEMEQAMLKYNGIGLAANQIGRTEALFVIDKKLALEYEVSSVFANPHITEYGKEADDLEEGCLSIPGLWVTIKRSKKIMFKALDGNGKRVKFRARGMLARVLQHETDHLYGTTIKDRSATKKSRSL